MFTIVNVVGNKVLLRYGAMSFYIYVDHINGKEVITKPRSVYIDKDAFNELIKIVFFEYRRSMNNNAESKN